MVDGPTADAFPCSKKCATSQCGRQCKSRRLNRNPSHAKRVDSQAERTFENLHQEAAETDSPLILLSGSQRRPAACAARLFRGHVPARSRRRSRRAPASFESLKHAPPMKPPARPRRDSSKTSPRIQSAPTLQSPDIWCRGRDTGCPPPVASRQITTDLACAMFGEWTPSEARPRSSYWLPAPPAAEPALIGLVRSGRPAPAKPRSGRPRGTG